MNAEELAAAASRAYMQTKIQALLLDQPENIMVLQIETEQGFNIVGIADGRAGLVGACEQARDKFGPIRSVIFNSDAHASKVHDPLAGVDHIIDALVTIVVVRDQAPAYRCYAYYELPDGGLQFEQSDLDVDTIQDVIIDLNRVW